MPLDVQQGAGGARGISVSVDNSRSDSRDVRHGLYPIVGGSASTSSCPASALRASRSPGAEASPELRNDASFDSVQVALLDYLSFLARREDIDRSSFEMVCTHTEIDRSHKSNKSYITQTRAHIARRDDIDRPSLYVHI